MIQDLSSKLLEYTQPEFDNDSQTIWTNPFSNQSDNNENKNIQNENKNMNSTTCQNYGKIGHIASNCSAKCSTCRRISHSKDYCYRGCWKCEKPGHFAIHCGEHP